MAYINRKQIEDYLKINADILFKSDFEIKEFLKNLYSIPVADVVPRSEVEHWKEEANRYQTLWCKTYNDFEISELITEAKQEVAREIFDELEKATKNHGICYTRKKIFELKKKYIGE